MIRLTWVRAVAVLRCSSAAMPVLSRPWAMRARTCRSRGVRTASRRFAEWTNAGLWKRLHAAFLDWLNVVSEIDWSRAMVDSIQPRGTPVQRWTRRRPDARTGAEACQPRAYRRTTVPGEAPVTSPDLIGRDFTVPVPGTLRGVKVVSSGDGIRFRQLCGTR